jgi:hypothetical protein
VSTTTEYHPHLLMATVIPTVDYASFVWSSRSLATMTKLLEPIQRIAAQAITGAVPYGDPTDRTSRSIHYTASDPLAEAITPNVDQLAFVTQSGGTGTGST